MSYGPKSPIRRSQLIAPFGTGAMIVIKGGTSLICAGLDHWFKREDQSDQINPNEYYIEEWRLQEKLKVNHFSLPPDYRDYGSAGDSLNIGLTIPFLRFPKWHFCQFCHLLIERPLIVRGKLYCPECETKNKKKKPLYQVPFVAMCDQGHLQDFPWKEWVHKSTRPTCDKPLRLVGTGSASLSGQIVKCDCGKSRNLNGITEASEGKTRLSSNLEGEEKEANPYLCGGHKPWLGTDEEESCGRPLRGSLRSASNLYFAQVQSAIYLPRSQDELTEEIISRLETPPLSTYIHNFSSFGAPIDTIYSTFKDNLLLKQYSQIQVTKALQNFLEKKNNTDESLYTEDFDPEDNEVAFRREEYEALQHERSDLLLKIREEKISKYEPEIAEFFSRFMLVEKLRETRAFTGFTRVMGENSQSLEQRKAMLWRKMPDDNDSWLPAYIVYGEGIFMELDEEKLQKWENLQEVSKRIENLRLRYNQLQQTKGLKEQEIGPRFLLMHTLSHLIMNRLIFECGYSSAALRERLYVSNNPKKPMAGILIYTADGDAEGTMGGLVRMGKPGYLEPIIRRALERAYWCSADPICMEIGNQGGQGPDSCNLAACHNCSLVPETACENFNRFLDRAVVIGDMKNPDLGFFKFR